MEAVLGIIGGSGLYDLPGLEHAEWRRVEGPWGEPSDDILFAELGGLKLRFLPRHGRGHRFSPTHINYRANIDAMKRAGVTDIVSVSAVGSLREDLAPGAVRHRRPVHRPHLRAREELLRRGRHRACLDGAAGQPAARRAHRARRPRRRRSHCHRGGTYIVMEGPQFSTLAESRLYRSWGCDVIGMTNMPEAKLAREAEISYATIAMVTDYDSWHHEHAPVDVKGVIRVMHENRERVQQLLLRLVRDFPREHEMCPIGSDRALEFAIMTAPEKRDPALLKKLDAVAGRVLKR